MMAAAVYSSRYLLRVYDTPCPPKITNNEEEFNFSHECGDCALFFQRFSRLYGGEFPLIGIRSFCHVISFRRFT